MPLRLKRRAAILSAIGILAILGSGGLYLKLSREVRAALSEPVKIDGELPFTPSVSEWQGMRVVETERRS